MSGSLPRSWAFQSSGPDRCYFNTGGILANFTPEESLDLIYDATNGTVSYGALFRVGGEVGSDHGTGFSQALRAVE